MENPKGIPDENRPNYPPSAIKIDSPKHQIKTPNQPLSINKRAYPQFPSKKAHVSHASIPKVKILGKKHILSFLPHFNSFMLN
jgi:hypothetical protein